MGRPRPTNFGHLVFHRLDGRSHGTVCCIRNTGIYAGIGVRVSKDGETWGPPSVIFNPGKEGAGDGTYPSTVQLADGTMVTAYYSSGVPAHARYHMGVVRWRIEEIASTSWGPLHWTSARWRD